MTVVSPIDCDTPATVPLAVVTKQTRTPAFFGHNRQHVSAWQVSLFVGGVVKKLLTISQPAAC